MIQDPGNARVKKRRDVSGRPRGIFRLAETVPPTWEGKGDEGEALKSRIKGLMEVETGKSMVDSAAEAEPEAGPSRMKRERESSGKSTASAGPSKRISPDRNRPAVSTQYKVIPPMSPRSRSRLPPKVYSHKE